MAVEYKSRRRLDKSQIPPLTIGAVGTVGVVACYLLVPGFQPIELVPLLLVVGFAAVGYTQGIIRGIMTYVMLYVATGIAATLYRTIAPYVSTLWKFFAILFTSDLFSSELSSSFFENVDYDGLALSFGLLTVVIWGILEIIGRASFRDTGLPGLGILDDVGGVIVHLVIGILVASLLFNAMGYGGLRHAHNQALLRPVFNQVLRVHYVTQSFWFPRRPPSIYVYDLGLPR